MTVSQLLTKARIRLGDPGKIKISDYSLLDALKSVLTLVSTALGNTTSNLLITRTEISLIDGAGVMPADFQSLVSVEDGWKHAPLNRKPCRHEYQLLGNQVYAQGDTVSILYKRWLQVGAITDPVPLPDMFTELLLKYIKIVLFDGIGQSDEALLGTISPEVYRLAAGREHTELRQTLIFKI